MMEMKRPKILFIMHMPPPVHGASMVGQYIHDSELVNQAFKCDFINPTTANNLADVGRFRLGKFRSLFVLLNTIKRRVKSFEPDVVYFTANTHGAAFIKDYLVVRLLKSMHSNVVLHFHNKGVKRNHKHLLYSFLYKRFFKDTKVILLSKMLYEDIAEYVDEKHVLYCPNGVPDIENRDKPQNNIGKPNTILFLSNLIETKGIYVLLEALQILKDRHIPFICNFVGGETESIKGDMFNRQIQQYGLSDCVFYLGKKYGDLKDQQYDSSSLFVFPTYYDNECFPLVLLEAMQHGLPCVSTYEGAIPEIISDGETGLLVKNESGNPPKAIELADAMESLLLNPEKAKNMGIQGRLRYENEYTLPAFEAKFVECINSTLE